MPPLPPPLLLLAPVPPPSLVTLLPPPPPALLRFSSPPLLFLSPLPFFLPFLSLNSLLPSSSPTLIFALTKDGACSDHYRKAVLLPSGVPSPRGNILGRSETWF